MSVGTRSGASPTLCPFTCFLHPPAHLESPRPHPVPRPLPNSSQATPFGPVVLSRDLFLSVDQPCRAERKLHSGQPDRSAHVRLTQSASVRAQHGRWDWWEWGWGASRTGIKPAQSSSPLPHLLQLVAAFASVTLDMCIISNSFIFM